MNEMEARAPLVHIVILNYNGPDLTLNCVDSVLKLEYPNFRVIVVDNASTDDSVARFKQVFTDYRIELLVNDRNEGYAGGNNRGIERALAADADYIFILNNDTLVHPGCLEPLVDAMEGDPRLGVCGCRIADVGQECHVNVGHRMNLYTGTTTEWSHDGEPSRPVDVDFVCGAAMLLRAETLRQVVGFDKSFFLYYEDADICFRTRQAGYSIRFVPGPGVRHLVGQTTRRHAAQPVVSFCGVRNRAWFVRRHGGLKHRLVFGLLAFSYAYPRIFLGRIVKGELRLLRPLLRGLWHGHLDAVRPATTYNTAELMPRRAADEL